MIVIETTTTKTIGSKTEAVVEVITAAAVMMEVMAAMVVSVKDGAGAIGMVVVVAEVMDGNVAAALNEPAVGMLNTRLTNTLGNRITCEPERADMTD
jgi:hypothetical protein